MLFATSCSSKPFAFCIKEQHIKIVETDWRMITTYCVCDPLKQQTGSMAWDWYMTMARCRLDAMRKYARRQLSGMSLFVHIISVHLLESVSAADWVTYLPVGIDYKKQYTKMDTLPNVNTRRGGNNPSHAGLTSNVSPQSSKPRGRELPYRGDLGLCA